MLVARHSCLSVSGPRNFEHLMRKFSPLERPDSPALSEVDDNGSVHSMQVCEIIVVV